MARRMNSGGSTGKFNISFTERCFNIGITSCLIPDRVNNSISFVGIVSKEEFRVCSCSIVTGESGAGDYFHILAIGI